jgi:RNA polymerase sigma-70 factor (ECF subfamily)
VGPSGSEPEASAAGAGADPVVELVCRARQGDGAAFARLVEVHGPALDGFCRRLMPEPGAAQDLAQDTLLRGFESLPRLADPARFGAWLCGIAANLARWWWRRQARWPLSLDNLAEAYPDVPRAAWAASLPATPEQAVERAEQTRRLAAAIEALPPALARAVALHYLEGLSYAEAAAALDVPVSTVKGRLFKSRTRLRRALAPAEPAAGGAGRSDARRRKESPAVDAVDAAPAPARLVPVTVEHLYPSGTAPTLERVRGALRRLFVAGAPGIAPVGQTPSHWGAGRPR